MDGETTWTVAGLNREAALHRVRRAEAGTQLHWPREVRRGAVALLAAGMSTGKLSRATGIPREALRNWRERSATEPRDRAGFSELRVVPVSTGRSPATSSSPSISALTLVGCRGNSVMGLDLHHIAALLQAGLL